MKAQLQREAELESRRSALLDRPALLTCAQNRQELGALDLEHGSPADAGQDIPSKDAIDLLERALAPALQAQSLELAPAPEDHLEGILRGRGRPTRFPTVHPGVDLKRVVPAGRASLADDGIGQRHGTSLSRAS